jgi:hypothetical protein
MTDTKWETYEQVAQHLLNEFADRFGLSHVEGKQTVHGNLSRTDWEIDAKGIRENNGGFIVVECRRHTTSGISQEQLAALAYRIIDTGARGGIIVSPLNLQEGAKKVAAASGVNHVILNADSTTKDYV